MGQSVVFICMTPARFAIVEEYKYLGVLIISSKRNESKGMERGVDSVVYHAGLKKKTSKFIEAV